jgi:hypothetical protein
MTRQQEVIWQNDMSLYENVWPTATSTAIPSGCRKKLREGGLWWWKEERSGADKETGEAKIKKEETKARKEEEIKEIWMDRWKEVRV